MSYTSILNLNTKLIFKILEYLDIEDQLNLARTCWRLEDIFKEFSKIHYSENQPFGNLTDDEAITFVQLVGEYIIECYHACNSRWLIRLASTNFCVKRLQIIFFHDDIWSSLSNLEKLQTLEEITLQNYTDKKNLGVLLNIFQKLTCLKKLDIFGHFADCVDSYNCLNMEEFSISSVYMSPKGFQNICISMPNLRLLKINFPLETAHLQAISENLKCLENFICKLNAECDQSWICEIPKLKYLSLVDGSHLTQTIFMKLTEKRANQLEGLHIDTYLLPCNITSYINDMHHLRYLHLNLDQSNLELVCGAMQSIFLPGLEYFSVETKIPLDKFLLKIIQTCTNLHSIYFYKYFEVKKTLIAKNFIIEVNKTLEKEGNKRIHLPICMTTNDSIDFQEFNNSSDLIKFFEIDEEPTNYEPFVLRQILKDRRCI